MSTSTLVSRLCACNCGERFTPTAKMPGRQYIYGHKPSGVGAPKRDVPAGPVNDGPRRMLDYRLALATIQRELKIVEGEIELCDDRLETCREESRKLQTVKDAAVERHGTLSQTAAGLQALIGNQPAEVVRVHSLHPAAQKEQA